jgi:hypothetical protein
VTHVPFLLLHMVKESIFTLKLNDIPEETVVGVFDYAQKDTVKGFYEKFQIGNSKKDFTIPSTWSKPWISVRSKKYQLLNKYRYMSLENVTEVKIDGGMYFLDSSREEDEETLNQKAVESLIYGPSSLTGRQKFYVVVVATESHFEYLTYNMLVTSGHMLKPKFDDLKEQKARIQKAFSKENTKFFAEHIELKPDNIIPLEKTVWTEIEKIKDIFEKICKLRNDIVHGWSLPNPKADAEE